MDALRRFRLGSWLLGGVALLGLLAASSPAQACLSGSRTRQHVVGVSPDGTFAVYREASSDNADLEPASFTLYDVRGHISARISSDKGQPEQGWSVQGEGACEGAWDEVLKRRDKAATISEVEEALVRRYRLTPLHPSDLATRVVPEAEGCGPILARTPDGEVPLQDVGPLSYYGEGGCTAVTTAALEHRSSPFLFVRIRYVMPLGEGLTADVDSVQWFPATRLAGLRAAERGRKALAHRQLGPALAALSESIALTPEYLPARLWTAQALAASGVGVQQAQQVLAVPFPESQPCLGGRPEQILDWYGAHAPASWGDLGDWPEESRPWDACGDRPTGLQPWVPADDSFEDSSPTCGEPSDHSGDSADPEPSAADEPSADEPHAPGACGEPVASEPPAAAPPAPWSADPRSVLLGAGAVLAFVLGYRRGARRDKREGQPPTPHA